MKEQIFTFTPLNEPSEILGEKEGGPTVSLGLLVAAHIPPGFSGGTPRRNCCSLAVAMVDVWLVHLKTLGSVSPRVFRNEAAR